MWEEALMIRPPDFQHKRNILQRFSLEGTLRPPS